ncbi:MAG TPA: DUF4190 domain-containing protein [Candidatus Absconditabacterales bacterium]|nr:DUF4190 domain-containing protein [Candidatus Absconditabacterales bacterium]
MPVKKKEQKSGLSVASLVISIVALVLCITIIGAVLGVPLAIVALIFGIIALVKKQNKGMAIAGTIISGLVILVTILLAIFGTIFIKKNADVFNPIVEFGQMMEADEELTELMKNPEFQSEFEYLMETRMVEKYENVEEIEGREQAKQEIPGIFEEMEQIVLELKEKYKD